MGLKLFTDPWRNGWTRFFLIASSEPLSGSSPLASVSVSFNATVKEPPLLLVAPALPDVIPIALPNSLRSSSSTRFLRASFSASRRRIRSSALSRSELVSTSLPSKVAQWSSAIWNASLSVATCASRSEILLAASSSMFECRLRKPLAPRSALVDICFALEETSAARLDSEIDADFIRVAADWGGGGRPDDPSTSLSTESSSSSRECKLRRRRGFTVALRARRLMLSTRDPGPS